MTVIWGGAAFLLTSIFTKKLVLSFGMMSPAIAAGVLQTVLTRN